MPACLSQPSRAARNGRITIYYTSKSSYCELSKMNGKRSVSKYVILSILVIFIMSSAISVLPVPPALRILTSPIAARATTNNIGIDTSYNSGWWCNTTGTTIKYNLTTTVSNDVILFLEFGNYSATPSATSLTFASRGSIAESSPPYQEASEYYAVEGVGPLTNDTLSTSIPNAPAGKVYCFESEVVAIEYASTSNPFSFSSPYTNSSSGGYPNVNLPARNSTTDLILNFGTDTGNILQSYGSGFTMIYADNFPVYVQYKIASYSVAETEYFGQNTTLYNSTASTYWVDMAESIQAATTITQPVDCTMANSASAATITPSQGSTFSCNGSVYNLAVGYGGSLILNEPADTSTVRYRFAGGLNTASQPSCLSGTCATWHITDYEELNNTFKASISAGTWSAGISLRVVGSLADLSSQVLAALSPTSGSSSSVSQPVWANYNQATWISNGEDSSGNGWLSSGTYSFTDTSGGNTHTIGFMKNIAAKSLTVTIANSGPFATLTLSGILCTPNSNIIADGLPQGIAGSSCTLNVPSDTSTTRYRFQVSSAASTTYSFSSSSSVTLYNQVNNTLGALPLYIGVTWNSSLSIYPVGSFVGLTNHTLCTISPTDGSSSLAATSSCWSDYNSTIYWPQLASVGSPIVGRWISYAYVNASLGDNLVSGGQSFNAPYYYQRSDTIIRYAVANGYGNSSAPLLHYYSDGAYQSYNVTTSASTVWIDYMSNWTLDNPLGGSVTAGPQAPQNITVPGIEQWVTTNATTGTFGITNPGFENYHNQYYYLFSYNINGTCTSACTPNLTFTANGTQHLVTLSTNQTAYWLDSGSSWNATKYIGSGGFLGYPINGTVSSPQIVNITYSSYPGPIQAPRPAINSDAIIALAAFGAVITVMAILASKKMIKMTWSKMRRYVPIVIAAVLVVSSIAGFSANFGSTVFGIAQPSANSNSANPILNQTSASPKLSPTGVGVGLLYNGIQAAQDYLTRLEKNQGPSASFDSISTGLPIEAFDATNQCWQLAGYNPSQTSQNQICADAHGSSYDYVQSVSNATTTDVEYIGFYCNHNGYGYVNSPILEVTQTWYGYPNSAGPSYKYTISFYVVHWTEGGCVFDVYVAGNEMVQGLAKGSGGQISNYCYDSNHQCVLPDTITRYNTGNGASNNGFDFNPYTWDSTTNSGYGSVAPDPNIGTFRYTTRSSAQSQWKWGTASAQPIYVDPNTDTQTQYFSSNPWSMYNTIYGSGNGGWQRGGSGGPQGLLYNNGFSIQDDYTPMWAMGVGQTQSYGLNNGGGKEPSGYVFNYKYAGPYTDCYSNPSISAGPGPEGYVYPYQSKVCVDGQSSIIAWVDCTQGSDPLLMGENALQLLDQYGPANTNKELWMWTSGGGYVNLDVEQYAAWIAQQGWYNENYGISYPSSPLFSCGYHGLASPYPNMMSGDRLPIYAELYTQLAYKYGVTSFSYGGTNYNFKGMADNLTNIIFDTQWGMNIGVANGDYNSSYVCRSGCGYSSGGTSQWPYIFRPSSIGGQMTAWCTGANDPSIPSDPCNGKNAWQEANGQPSVTDRFNMPQEYVGASTSDQEATVSDLTALTDYWNLVYDNPLCNGHDGCNYYTGSFDGLQPFYNYVIDSSICNSEGYSGACPTIVKYVSNTGIDSSSNINRPYYLNIALIDEGDTSPRTLKVYCGGTNVYQTQTTSGITDGSDQVQTFQVYVGQLGNNGCGHSIGINLNTIDNNAQGYHDYWIVDASLSPASGLISPTAGPSGDQFSWDATFPFGTNNNAASIGYWSTGVNQFQNDGTAWITTVFGHVRGFSQKVQSNGGLYLSDICFSSCTPTFGSGQVFAGEFNLQADSAQMFYAQQSWLNGATNDGHIVFLLSSQFSPSIDPLSQGYYLGFTLYKNSDGDIHGLVFDNSGTLKDNDLGSSTSRTWIIQVSPVNGKYCGNSNIKYCYWLQVWDGQSNRVLIAYLNLNFQYAFVYNYIVSSNAEQTTAGEIAFNELGTPTYF